MGYLSKRLGIMLRRLVLDYKVNGHTFAQELITSSRYFVHENVAWDNLDGGIDGHDIEFFLPEEIISQIPLDSQDKMCSELSTAIGNLIPASAREYLNAVRFELADEGDEEFQKATPYNVRPTVSPAALSFWNPGQVRLFISHRDAHKAGANKLAQALAVYGVSSFVAHDTIQPMKEWRHEILRGLETMEVFLIYLTDDFTESLWCQQEVGFALGKGIPILSLKLEKNDPPGFIGNVQALKGSVKDPEASAVSLYRVLGEVLGADERLADGLVAAFAASESYDQARSRFDRMKKAVPTLTTSQVETIVQEFSANDSLNRAIYLDNHHNRLVGYMKSATAKDWKIDGRSLKEVRPVDDDLDDDIPF